MDKVVVLSSGGLDSTVALALAVSHYGPENVISLSITYGQKHIREIESARKVAEHYAVEHIEKDLTDVFEFSKCTLLNHTDKSISEETYAEQLKKADIVDTYVPFRNGLFLSCATAIALSLDASIIVYGAHADDAAGSAYPDCSKAFVNNMDAAIQEGTGGKVRLIAPFVKLTKADIVKMGNKLHVPFELTWSCYNGGEKPCGKCATCKDRAKAFEINGLIDPLMINN